MRAICLCLPLLLLQKPRQSKLLPMDRHLIIRSEEVKLLMSRLLSVLHFLQEKCRRSFARGEEVIVCRRDGTYTTAGEYIQTMKEEEKRIIYCPCLPLLPCPHAIVCIVRVSSLCSKHIFVALDSLIRIHPFVHPLPRFYHLHSDISYNRVNSLLAFPF